MEIKGKIIAVLESRSGKSKRDGSDWMSQDYVIETADEQFPKRVCFTIFGEDKIKSANINLDEELTVYFDVDAHEYNGKWFNSVRAWRVMRDGESPADYTPKSSKPYINSAQPEAKTPKENEAHVDSGDLPF